MDIKHLRYFISIVNNDFNLSRTAQNLYISQPTLSIMINDFESREGTSLFKRNNGKIVGLTYIGEKYYDDAQEVIKKYNEMQMNLHEAADTMAGIRVVVSDLVVPSEGYEKAVGVSLGGSAQFIVSLSEKDKKKIR